MIIASRVTEIFMDCLFKKDEPHNDYVVGEGITANFGFHPKRISNYTSEITEMLNDFPDKFYEKGNGRGWSFLNFCNTKDL